MQWFFIAIESKLALITAQVQDMYTFTPLSILHKRE